MPQKALSMHQIKEVLRLHDLGRMAQSVNRCLIECLQRHTKFRIRRTRNKVATVLSARRFLTRFAHNSSSDKGALEAEF